MAQKRKNEVAADQNVKRRKGELPVVQIDGITRAIQHPEMIASALRVKGLHPARPFQINRQKGEAFVLLKNKADQMKLLGLGSIRVNGIELKAKQLPPKSAKLFGLRDSFLWRHESQCFFEAATGLCFDPSQGIYLFWDSANQVYTRVQGDATKPPIGPPSRPQPPIQQQYNVPQQGQVWTGQPQHQQLINPIPQHNQQLINNHQATAQQPKVQMMIQSQPAQIQATKEVENKLKSVKVKLEIEKNASNFLRKHVTKITKEKLEAQKLVKDKDKFISKLSSENQRHKQKMNRLEKSPKIKKGNVQEIGEMKKEVERLKALEKKHTEGKKQLQEALKQMREKEKAKDQTMKQLRANNAKQLADKENQILQLKQLLDQAQKSTDAAVLAKIQLLESEKMKWKNTCDKLSKELTITKNELNKEQEKNSELMGKIEKLEKAEKAVLKVSIPENLPPPPPGKPSVEESKDAASDLPKDVGDREKNEQRARAAELGMQVLREKLEGTGELFTDVRDQIGKLKNTVKLNSIQVEQNVTSVKPKFAAMLEVLKQVSGICSNATKDLLNYNETALSFQDNGIMKEIGDLSAKMTEVTISMKDLDQSFVSTQPTFSVLMAEVQHQKAANEELRNKLKESKKALNEEKRRRDTAEDVKEEISKLKKLIKKKKRRRRSYSPSRSSSSRSRSASYRSRG